MIQFLLGLFLVAVAATGSGGALMQQVAKEKGFIPFALACAIVFYVWTETPPPEQKPVRTLIVVALMAALIAQEKRLAAAIAKAWAEVTGLGSGGGPQDNGFLPFASGGQGFSPPVIGGSSSGGSTSSGPLGFLQEALPFAQQTAAKLNVPVNYVLGQWALETGYGTSSAFQNENNPAGINVPGGTGADYQSYSSPAAGFSGFQNLLTQDPRYANVAGSQSALQYGQALQGDGYASDPSYASKLANTANSPTILSFLQGNGIGS
jgi:hypothetical protein